MELLQYFRYDHLPEHLQKVSRPFAELASQILVLCPAAGQQREWALSLLLLAKDAAVRASLEAVKQGTRWAVRYRIDGFTIDTASFLTRGEAVAVRADLEQSGDIQDAEIVEVLS